MHESRQHTFHDFKVERGKFRDQQIIRMLNHGVETGTKLAESKQID